MAARRAAVAARHLSRRLLSSSTSSSPAAATPRLLGHFHNPIATDLPLLDRIPSDPVFQPLTASSPRLSLDFIPDAASGFSLFDSHQGLLLLLQGSELGPRFLVCDPVARRHALLPPPPTAAFWDGEFVGGALLARAGAFDFDAVCLTVHVDRPRAWVASFRDGDFQQWLPMPRSRSVSIYWPPTWVEHRCVHAAGRLYWHICNNASALALDPATMEFSFLRAPAMVWEDFGGHIKYRVGEMPGDGRLCVATLEADILRICARVKDCDAGWVMERNVSLGELFYSVSDRPTFCPWLSDMDAGRTGRVFIRAPGYGHFAYNLETGKLDHLRTDDGKDYGHPMFAYFAPDAGSD
ncbi:hypothetical protein EJB05_44610, partial [Eragrostis curvula]